ncbi:type VII secretion protein EssA [Bacillus sp. DX4.1]|uniref:type VII secretion protein EssA n=1 Tax=Bacillus sp. DX4.1 TaxID=3055867 RepID=UPI0025A1E3AB|nr:type VII secretion protein EssA [Bacillus sp. DX4.1]MDM5188341.1 type VII secretion protein EssA [Bacillus sp. DX4.1]
MIKQWRILAKLSFVFFLFLFVALPIRCAADSYLDDDGKIEFKVDRVEQTDQEINKKGQQETELDKAAIELFNPTVEKEIDEKQKKEKKEMKELNDSLFLDTKKVNDVKEAKKSLFDKNYIVKESSGEIDSNQSTSGESISKTMTGLFIGGIVFICIGIYIILRKTWA